MTVPPGMQSFTALGVQPTRENVVGAIVLCPHCSQLLQIVSASERQEGEDPARGNQRAGFFYVTLSDGTVSRLWETE